LGNKGSALEGNKGSALEGNKGSPIEITVKGRNTPPDNNKAAL